MNYFKHRLHFKTFFFLSRIQSQIIMKKEKRNVIPSKILLTIIFEIGDFTQRLLKVHKQLF